MGKTEKILLTIGGGALAIYGITRRSTAGLMVTALGAGMLHRGLTGYCEIYESFGIDRANGTKRDRVARDIHVEKAVTIDPAFIITHRMNLNDAAFGYQTFNNKEDECIKIVMKP